MSGIDQKHTCNRIFVYGTLINTDFFAKLFKKQPNEIDEGWIFGVMYDCGNFPMVAKDQKRKVYGLIYAVSDLEQLLPEIDRYERCNVEPQETSLYEREIVDAHFDLKEKVHAWTYFGNSSSDFFKRLCVEKNLVPSGRWSDLNLELE